MTLPMFEQIKLVNFYKLDKWCNVVPCWLDIFLNFAYDSYQFIAFPTRNDLESIIDVLEHKESTTEYAFDFLDGSFHTIIDDAYRNHLALVFLVFGAPDGSIEIKGKEQGNWTTSFAAYHIEVFKNLGEWAESRDRPREYCAHLSALIERVTYILDKAYHDYQIISKLGVLISLACNTFIQDLGNDLYQLESPMFEVCFAISTNSLKISDHFFHSSL